MTRNSALDLGLFSSGRDPEELERSWTRLGVRSFYLYEVLTVTCAIHSLSWPKSLYIDARSRGCFAEYKGMKGE